ncbi:hypothetical protein AB2J17_05785 [Citrobacter freundii]|uniref:hypothetical protein n=1 Tax=Citrobacter freundii TaxID=546 RepID=UPI0034A1D69A
MAIYHVSYDLNKSGQNYQGMYDELMETDYCHYAESSWLIDTSETAEQVWSRLSSSVDENDTVLIIRVTTPYQGWLSKECWDWLNSRTF